MTRAFSQEDVLVNQNSEGGESNTSDRVLKLGFLFQC